MDALCKTGESMGQVKICDFSRDGLGIIHGKESRVSAGEDVEIWITIPGDSIPAVVTGQIMWTDAREARSGFRKSGVKIREINNSDRGRILNYVYRKWMMPKDKNHTGGEKNEQ